jgi:hypothetical protein
MRTVNEGSEGYRVMMQILKHQDKGFMLMTSFLAFLKNFLVHSV